MVKYLSVMIIFSIYIISLVFIISSYSTNTETSQLTLLIFGILLLFLTALLLPNANKNSDRSEMELLDDIIRSTNVDYDFEFENNNKESFQEDKIISKSNHPFCPNCGTLFEMDSIFCMNCGTRL